MQQGHHPQATTRDTARVHVVVEILNDMEDPALGGIVRSTASEDQDEDGGVAAYRDPALPYPNSWHHDSVCPCNARWFEVPKFESAGWHRQAQPG